MKRLSLLTILILSLPEVVSANASFPLAYLFPLPIYFIILIEFLVFGALVQFLEDKELQIGLKRLLAGVVMANIISSGIGTLIPVLSNMVLGFALSVPAEWLVYHPFFSRYVKDVDLLKISFIVNLVSYGLLYVFTSFRF